MKTLRPPAKCNFEQNWIKVFSETNGGGNIMTGRQNAVLRNAIKIYLKEYLYIDDIFISKIMTMFSSNNKIVCC